MKWTKTPFLAYDFGDNQELRSCMWAFLDTVEARYLAANVANIRKSLCGDRLPLVQTIPQHPPDSLDLGLTKGPGDVRLTNVSYMTIQLFSIMIILSLTVCMCALGSGGACVPSESCSFTHPYFILYFQWIYCQLSFSNGVNC